MNTGVPPSNDVPTADPDSQGYRPANLKLLERLPAQRIPRHIIQIGYSWAAALKAHEAHMQTWWRLNGEYEYRFFSDAQAITWMKAHASADELRAYEAVKLGPQRSDIFRVLFCKQRGCVYADLDKELLRPLRDIIPSEASAVTGYHWPFEWLMYEAGHPIMVETSAAQARNILVQLDLYRTNATHSTNGTQRCGSPHSCVMKTTGPDTYINGIWRASKAANCTNPIQRVEAGECENTTDQYWRRTYMCASDKVEPGLPMMHCHAARHWDCRTTGIRRCSRDHWQSGWHYTRREERTFAHFFHV